jgi:hypothetical protein
MFNVVFCYPGTKVIDLESEPHWIHAHRCLLASCDLEYGFFVGQAADRCYQQHHQPWTVNIEALVQRIMSLGTGAQSNIAKLTPLTNIETAVQSETEAVGSMPTNVRADRDGPRSSDLTAPPTQSPLVMEAAMGNPDSGEPMPEIPFWSLPDLTGEQYGLVLQRFHRILKPKSYLEIGVLSGDTLDIAECPSIAVDPKLAIERPVLRNKPACCLFQMTSDEFFGQFDPSVILGRPIDMAFLDGMHLFEHLLRDFINTEGHCKPNSIVLIHDCIPTDEYVGRREVNEHRLRNRSRHPEWWAGDVWKVVAIIFKHRPDLRVVVFNAGPTGLAAVTNLDPSSTLLKDRYFDIIDEYGKQTLRENGDAYCRTVNILDTRDYATFEAMSSLFWL